MPRVLLRVCTLQGVALVGLAGYLAVRSTDRAVHDPRLVLLVAALTLGTGALFVVGAIGLRRGRRWPRTPLGLGELFAVLVGVELAAAHRWGYAAVVGLPALAVFAGLARERVRSGR